MLYGKSFRDGDEDLVHYEDDWWRIIGTVDGVTRDVRYQPSLSRSKQLYIDEVTKGRLTYKHQLPVVLFEPDDLLVIHNSPSTRRSYIDTLVQKIDPTYKKTLTTYDRALLQRNNILKQHQSINMVKDAVFAWDLLLADYGAQIINKRQKVIAVINKEISKEYSLLAGKDSSVEIIYQPTIKGVTSSAIASHLSSGLRNDIHRGYTSIGPHRDDIDIILNQQLAKSTASRGEVRTIMLSLKLIEARMIIDARDISPLVLLDDVFSELDKKRQIQLLTATRELQTVITTTDSDIPKHKQSNSVIKLN